LTVLCFYCSAPQTTWGAESSSTPSKLAAMPVPNSPVFARKWIKCCIGVSSFHARPARPCSAKSSRPSRILSSATRTELRDGALQTRPPHRESCQATRIVRMKHGSTFQMVFDHSRMSSAQADWAPVHRRSRSRKLTGFVGTPVFFAFACARSAFTRVECTSLNHATPFGRTVLRSFWPSHAPKSGWRFFLPAALAYAALIVGCRSENA
jgi:hypothetical protein